MTQEKKYNEALERAKHEYQTHKSFKGFREMLAHIFPELAESEDEKIRRCIGMCLTDVNEQRFKDFNTNLRDCLNWLEKQGAQKRINDTDEEIVEAVKNTSVLDMVEPKFKVGDWVVTSYGKVNQVISIDNISVDKNDNGYTLDDGTYFSGSWCDMYHLWTIQDAKDGDVLVCNDNPFLFSKYEKDEYGLICCSYCGIADSDYGEFLINTNAKKYWCDIEFVYPATKEQRDLLFQKMVEAGYLWDENKKELRAINLYCQENCKGYQETGRCFADGECEAKKNAETGWSEEDENILNAITYTVKNSGYKHCIGVSNEIMTDWLESIKDRVQPKQEWSEEDERIFSEIILRCKKYGRQEQIDWLKSIKQRIGWKPNEEQMEALKCAIEDVAKFSKRYGLQVELENEPYYSALHSLYEQLKKLKGE